MLKQMLSEDKAESVRQAIVRSLGITVAFIDDEEKFKPCWELMLRALNDSSQLVVTSTYGVLLPALAAWAFELGTLESDLVSYFLHQLLTCIKVCTPLSLLLSSYSHTNYCVCKFVCNKKSWLFLHRNICTYLHVLSVYVNYFYFHF